MIRHDTNICKDAIEKILQQWDRMQLQYTRLQSVLKELAQMTGALLRR